MSEDPETADRNFRSAYYKSLGFKEGEKSITHLEMLLKAEIFDVKKLKLFCLKHTLTVFYRPLVWKIILSVIPVFSDKETCSFVKEQKRIEFSELKHALQVMGRIEHSLGAGMTSGGVANELSSKSNTSSPSYPSPLSNSEHPMNPSQQSSSNSPPLTSLLPPYHSLPQKIQEVRATDDPSSTGLPNIASTSVDEPLSTSFQTFHEHRSLSQNSLCSSQDFVIIFLLEKNQLLSSSANQMKKEEQINMLAIAEAFLTLFEEESEDDIYWLFSNFIKKLESQIILKEELLLCFSQLLEDIDCVLLEHIKDLDALENGIPIQQWFYQCYASVLPQSSLESIWDRVIGGSTMVLVYVAVAIVLSLKRKILGVTSAEKLKHLLDTIPEENFGLIVSKAIEQWEAHGSPLRPSLKVEESPTHELHYEIEDYS